MAGNHCPLPGFYKNGKLLREIITKTDVSKIVNGGNTIYVFNKVFTIGSYLVAIHKKTGNNQVMPE